MQPSDVLRQNPETAARDIDGSVYVLHAETSELHALNDVGARMWELLDGVRTVADIASAIEAEYDVDLSQAQADSLTFFDELAAKGLVLSA